MHKWSPRISVPWWILSLHKSTSVNKIDVKINLLKIRIYRNNQLNPSVWWQMFTLLAIFLIALRMLSNNSFWTNYFRPLEVFILPATFFRELLVNFFLIRVGANTGTWDIKCLRLREKFSGVGITGRSGMLPRVMYLPNANAITIVMQLL